MDLVTVSDLVPLLYEDNHLLVVEKPVGMLSQKDKTGDPDLLSVLKGYLKEKYQKPGAAYLGLIHRLDRMVGGIIVFAKTSKAAARLNRAFLKRLIVKKYLAIVEGETENAGHFCDFIEKDAKTVRSRLSPMGKAAELYFWRLAFKDGYSLVKIKLITGRHHQIRVQFSARSHPLQGDGLYGGKGGATPALFAYYLEFFHPVTKEKLTFLRYPQGDNWRAFLPYLTKSTSEGD